MKIWMIPTKGKGCEVTARNIAQNEETELARPLTSDPWDNALLIEEDGDIEDSTGNEPGLH